MKLQKEFDSENDLESTYGHPKSPIQTMATAKALGYEMRERRRKINKMGIMEN